MYKPRRAVYVIFHRSGEVYAGKYYDVTRIGKSYFGSSSIAKLCGLEIAHILKWELPEGTTADECDAIETALIDYIAARYGLDNRVYYRADEDFYKRFPHNGRCINCHDKDSKSLRELKPIQLNAQALLLYGKPFSEVTEEDRKQYRQNYNRNSYLAHKEERIQYAKEYALRNKEKLDLYHKSEHFLALKRNGARAKYQANPKEYAKKRMIHMKVQRKNARATFGFFEYLDIDNHKRKVSINEIDSKKLRFEPKNTEWKKYFFCTEPYEAPVIKEKQPRRASRQESFDIFGFSAYTDINGKRREVSASERKLKTLSFEPLKAEYKHFYKIA